MAKRPRIGVSGPDRGGLVAWFFTWLAVLIAGGKAVRITPQKRETIDDLDGLILGGGADIDPGLYGAEQKKLSALSSVENNRTFWRICIDFLFFPLLLFIRKLLSTKQYNSTDLARDDLEKKLVVAAMQRRIPILGICRGAQLLNVVHGGSLHHDLKEFYLEVPQVRSILPRKKVDIIPNSLLGRIMKKEKSMVNALHHQAINDLGKGLIIVAKEPNGIIQAIENQSYLFLLGIQWHPEYLPQHRSQRAIFKALINAAKGR